MTRLDAVSWWSKPRSEVGGWDRGWGPGAVTTEREAPDASTLFLGGVRRRVRPSS